MLRPAWYYCRQFCETRVSYQFRLGSMNSEVFTHAINKGKEVASGASRQARPFLKWAGGKRQLLPQIRQFYPGSFGSYIEPFVGSGAVFFDLYNQGLLDRRRSVLIDNNADLVGGYTAVRDRTAQVICSLSRLAAGYKADPQEHYSGALLQSARQAVQSGSAADLQWKWP